MTDPAAPPPPSEPMAVTTNGASFPQAVRICLEKYADFSGRAARSEYWWFYLAVVLLNIVLTTGLGLLGLTDTVIGSVVSLVVAIGVLIPSLAVGARRLHDRDMSGWLLLLGLIPIVGVIILIVLFVLPGTPGPNKYGPVPQY